jgi:formate hydrogenlyase subunit 5
MSTLPREGEELPERRRAPAVSPRPPERSLDGLEEERALTRATGAPVKWESGEELWSVSVDPERWLSSCQFVSETLGHPLSSLFGEDARERESGIRVHALFLGHAPSAGVHLLCRLDPHEPHVASLSSTIPFVTPFEREVAEMFGVRFDGATDLRPLLLHERHPAPPLLKGAPSAPTGKRSDYSFQGVEGEGIYEIPVGPVHAGVIEPGHFRFQVVGEHILDLETRFGYTHKGTERLFEGQSTARGTIWAESVSGDMSVAGGLAYAHAVERALGLQVPSEVEDARGLLAEIERIAFLCGDVAGISLDVGYAVGAARANVLRERAYTILGSLTGSRLGRAQLAVGGLRRRLEVRDVGELRGGLQELSDAIQALLDHLLDKSSVVDRLQGTGKIPRWTAEELHFLGPTARASGLRIDLRVDRPYGAYRGREVRVPRGLEGDVQDRLKVKVQEIVEACRLSSLFLPQAATAGPAASPPSAPPGDLRAGLGWVESPRGEFLVYVVVGTDGCLERVHIRDPSFLTWPAIEHAVHGNIVPDFPLCNKSLNLSYSGYDR